MMTNHSSRIRSRACAIAFVVGLASRYLAAQEPLPVGRPNFPPVVVVTRGDVPIRRLSYIDAGTRQYGGSVGGLRSYLESIRSSEPQLYVQLDPELGRLEARRNIATAILVGGLAVGAAATIYAFAGAKDCGASSSVDRGVAWTRCNDDNFDTTVAFTLIGASSATVGLLAWFFIKPDHSDLVDFVDEHNRVSPRPLRWALGYDPAQHFAYASVQLELTALH